MKHVLILAVLCILRSAAIAQADSSWFNFTADGKECLIHRSQLPTPWMNRLSNDVFSTWITHNGYIETYLLDPVYNGLTNPQKTSGHFYIRDKKTNTSFLVNEPVNESGWQSAVGLGYNRITNKANGLGTVITYFIPREDNVLIMKLDITNTSSAEKQLDVFGQVEWNLGDPVKSIIYRGDGRGGSQFNLYKKAYLENNTLYAEQDDWRSTGKCIPWPYTGYFNVNEPIAGYETVRQKFLGVGGTDEHPAEVESGNCSNTPFWSEAEYPWGVLQNAVTVSPGKTKTLIYTLGMERSHQDIGKTIKKYTAAHVEEAFADLAKFYNDVINHSTVVETPDKDNDRIINIWTKYMWRQFFKKSLNTGAYGLGLWSYGLEGETMFTAPEHFIVPVDNEILHNNILDLFREQLSDTNQTDLFDANAHTMLYKDLGIDGPDKKLKGQFSVPHHHQILGYLFSVYYYLLESGDLALLDKQLPYLDGKMGTVWQHIQTALTISTKGISHRGLPRIPKDVGDWMDEFTFISKNGNAESEMLAGELCFMLKGFSDIALKYNHGDDARNWMEKYEVMKVAVNKLAWDGEWYIRAFSDRHEPMDEIGSHKNREGKIYLNGQSWPVIAGIASSDRARRSMSSVKKYLSSDYGPLIFSPAYTSLVDYIGTQSIYAPGFRNACIYLRPAGWAIMAASISGDAALANQMYNSASLAKRASDIQTFQCEPYAYPENYNGPDHRLRGKGEFQWNLGEGASWMWYSYVNYILGVRAELGGLLIDPMIPKEWKGFKVKRPFRGAVYDIEVRNPGHVESGIKSIMVDGKKIKGNIVVPFNDSKAHSVIVIMG